MSQQDNFKMQAARSNALGAHARSVKSSETLFANDNICTRFLGGIPEPCRYSERAEYARSVIKQVAVACDGSRKICFRLCSNYHKSVLYSCFQHAPGAVERPTAHQLLFMIVRLFTSLSPSPNFARRITAPVSRSHSLRLRSIHPMAT